MRMPTTTLSMETAELLQQLIRNRCVNDGTPGSGNETRNARDLRDYLEGSRADLAMVAAARDRASLVGRIEGTDASAPSLCLLGHTDVVPATPANWIRDPFGGELVGGEVWGRGAIDMLNLTASMAVAVRQISRSGFRPRGTLIYVAVADEEAGSRVGAEFLTGSHYDEIRSDYVITESGGITRPGPGGLRVLLSVGEKGLAWRRLRIRGTAGHGSTPFGSDNALVKAAEIIRRLAGFWPASVPSEVARNLISLLDVPDEVIDRLADPERAAEACAALANPRIAALVHATTRMTISPNVIHGGIKTNIIPDTVYLDVDIRTLPRQTSAQVDDCLREALGDMASAVTWEPLQESEATLSVSDSPLRGAMERVTRRFYPDAQFVPCISTAGSDARFFRQKGAVAYGFGLFSRAMTVEAFSERFHGNNERVDIESLGLTTQMWIDLIREFLG
jgi:acetylornithine deacetylase/succinyl-diaminopimelate desuccinylase-like protein